LSQFKCVDCKVDTDENGEYYMVTNNIWRNYGAGRGMLCIGCLELRIGRKLDKYDFMNVPVNYLGYRSERMINRLEN
jgi:hypothetical protein